jgi:hypothetical protein
MRVVIFLIFFFFAIAQSRSNDSCYTEPLFSKGRDLVTSSQLVFHPNQRTVFASCLQGDKVLWVCTYEDAPSAYIAETHSIADGSLTESIQLLQLATSPTQVCTTNYNIYVLTQNATLEDYGRFDGAKRDLSATLNMPIKAIACRANTVLALTLSGLVLELDQEDGLVLREVLALPFSEVADFGLVDQNTIAIVLGLPPVFYVRADINTGTLLSWIGPLSQKVATTAFGPCAALVLDLAAGTFAASVLNYWSECVVLDDRVFVADEMIWSRSSLQPLPGHSKNNGNLNQLLKMRFYDVGSLVFVDTCGHVVLGGLDAKGALSADLFYETLGQGSTDFAVLDLQQDKVLWIQDGMLYARTQSLASNTRLLAPLRDAVFGGVFVNTGVCIMYSDGVECINTDAPSVTSMLSFDKNVQKLVQELTLVESDDKPLVVYETKVLEFNEEHLAWKTKCSRSGSLGRCVDAHDHIFQDGFMMTQLEVANCSAPLRTKKMNSENDVVALLLSVPHHKSECLFKRRHKSTGLSPVHLIFGCIALTCGCLMLLVVFIVYAVTYRRDAANRTRFSVKKTRSSMYGTVKNMACGYEARQALWCLCYCFPGLQSHFYQRMKDTNGAAEEQYISELRSMESLPPDLAVVAAQPPSPGFHSDVSAPASPPMVDVLD